MVEYINDEASKRVLSFRGTLTEHFLVTKLPLTTLMVYLNEETIPFYYGEAVHMVVSGKSMIKGVSGNSLGNLPSDNKFKQMLYQDRTYGFIYCFESEEDLNKARILIS